MTKSAVAYSILAGSTETGRDLGRQLNEGLAGKPPDALIVFASARYDYSELLKSLDDACHPRLLVGCSSAGEFTSDHSGDSAASAIALTSDDLRFNAALGQGLRSDRNGTTASLIASFEGLTNHNYLYRSALVLTDALAGEADTLVEQLTVLTAGTYQFFGGGAGDDGLFSRTHVFYGTAAYNDAVVALEILSNKPVGIGVSHGWLPATPALRLTEVEGMSMISLNATPALEIFQEHASDTGQVLDAAQPLPFFLNNIVGIASDSGYKLRVPLGINPNGAVPLAAGAPTGSTLHIMQTSAQSSAVAAAEATRSALAQLNGHKPHVALFFDCVATRLRMGQNFGQELAALQAELGDVDFAGCNTYGQIARAEGQFNGFHNCTAVVCVLPE